LRPHVGRYSVAEQESCDVQRLHMLGTSGTVTTIAGVHLDLRRYERRRVDGCWLNDDQVRRGDRAACWR